MKNILLIDDDRNLLSSLAEFLRDKNDAWNILTAENGQLGAEIIDTREIDIIVTDLRMPVMDGYSLITYAGKQKPGMPVIVMTADSTSDQEKRLQLLGVKQCIDKPVLLPEIVRTISNWIA